MTRLPDIVDFLDRWLGIASVPDESANGLQVEGVAEVSRVGLAVDAALATYRRAADMGCQMLFVHHGLIWGGLKAVTGRARDHLALLIGSGMSLYAAHLPLDVHPEAGNAAQLARVIGLRDAKPFGLHRGVEVGLAGELPQPMSFEALAVVFQNALGGSPEVLAFGPEVVRTMAIVPGGGGSALPQAVERGLDCFVTGEGSHPNHHAALEGRIDVVYLGHYRSETLGVRAVGDELERVFGLETVFIDEPTRF